MVNFEYLFKCVDFLGNSITLKHRGSETLKTLTGGILSTIIIILTIPIVIYYLINFLYNNNPIVTTAIHFRDNSKSINLPVEFLNFSLSIFETYPHLSFFPLRIKEQEIKVLTLTPLNKQVASIENVGNFTSCKNINFMAPFVQQFSFLNFSDC
jgi:hypothetical protein